MEGAANTAALANQAAHDTNARIRLVEHLDARRRSELKAYATARIASYPRIYADADDIFNEMLAAVYEGYRKAQFKVQPSRESFYALIRGIIFNLVSEEARYANTQGRSPARECANAPADFVDTEIDGQRVVDCNDVIEQCRQDIQVYPGLDDEQRELLIALFYLKVSLRASHEQIAEKLGHSESRVRSLQELLRSILEPRKEDLNG
jgi:DNA-directed RNA polymerase specialized sigma24 family protein